MALKSKCGNCKRESSETDGWWTVNSYKTEPPEVYDLCPSCYRNKSLLAYRDTLLERIDALDLPYKDGSEWQGMEVMKLRCKAIVRDTVFNV
jgi:hypothetical protein